MLNVCEIADIVWCNNSSIKNNNKKKRKKDKETNNFWIVKFCLYAYVYHSLKHTHTHTTLAILDLNILIFFGISLLLFLLFTLLILTLLSQFFFCCPFEIFFQSIIFCYQCQDVNKRIGKQKSIHVCVCMCVWLSSYRFGL